MTLNERWLPVPGHEGAYEVSDWGNVRSIDRIIITKTGDKQRHRGRILSPGANPSGHLHVNLGRSETLLVHRLVLGAFVGPAPEGMECCHNDGNPANNKLSNLRWDTRSQNHLDRVRHGTHYQAAKTNCPRGHALVSPNLRQYEMKLGHRKCLACSRARAYVYRHPGITHDLQQVSDDYYRSIMTPAQDGLFAA